MLCANDMSLLDVIEKLLLHREVLKAKSITFTFKALFQNKTNGSQTSEKYLQFTDSMFICIYKIWPQSPACWIPAPKRPVNVGDAKEETYPLKGAK